MEDLLSRSVAAEERARQLESELMNARKPAPWLMDDPREHTGRWRRIVIVTGDDVLLGDVEPQRHCVFLHDIVEQRSLIDANDEWPGWFWVPAPAR